MFGRVDHLAFRLKDCKPLIDLYISAFGYKITSVFEPVFDDGSTQGTTCTVLSPPERRIENAPWSVEMHGNTYYLPFEIFCSVSSEPDSVVSKWVANRNGGQGSLHHIAIQTDNIQKSVSEWKEKGFGNFLSEDIIECPDLKQIFSTPTNAGIIYEFIERGKHGFCQESVARLMTLTKDCENS